MRSASLPHISSCWTKNSRLFLHLIPCFRNTTVQIFHHVYSAKNRYYILYFPVLLVSFMSSDPRAPTQLDSRVFHLLLQNPKHFGKRRSHSHPVSSVMDCLLRYLRMLIYCRERVVRLTMRSMNAILTLEVFWSKQLWPI